MKIVYFISSLLLMAPSFANCQNLVPNHDFSILEPSTRSDFCNSTVNNSVSFPQWTLQDWDYMQNSLLDGFFGTFHLCRLVGYPRPGDGIHPMPYEGEGYTGLLNGMMGYTNYTRDNISWGYSRLISPLEKDSIYVMEIHVQLMTYHYLLDASPNEIQALFTVDPIPDSVGIPFGANFTPQFDYRDGITDSTKWTKISQSFVADGDEQYLTFGNFTGNFDCIPWNPNDTTGYSATYLDAIYVYKASDTLFTVGLPSDTTLCFGETLTLLPKALGFDLEDTVTTYKWNTGSSDSMLVVSQSGTYEVELTINKRWKQRASIVVDYYPEIPQDLYPNPVLVCDTMNTLIELPYFPEVSYYWNGIRGSETVVFEGTGQVIYEMIHPCWTLKDSVEIILDRCTEELVLPNAISPNGDGLNDCLDLSNVPKPFDIEIYDRWGTLKYQARNYQNDWSPQDLDIGTYGLVIRYIPLGSIAYKQMNTYINIIK